ncbi:MAG: ABC transporter permease subunit [Chloroflexota bacterium]|nr:ABC transporter permease subunit [Chloroflexota bacterium]
MLKKLFTGRRGRQIKEYLTAYIFIAPATILIFIFGIFPVGFALFVSLHKWRIKRTAIIGLQNYVGAIGNLAFVLVFFLGIGALVGVYFLLKRILTMAHENDDRPWLCLLPGFVHALVIFGLLNWFYRALPEILDIATKLRGVERTQSVFLGLLKEALRAESVLPSWRFLLWSMLAGIITSIIVLRVWRNQKNFTYQSKFALVFMAMGAGVGLLYYTYQQVSQAYAAAFAEGMDPGIWPQFISISGGVILLVLAWILWQSAQNRSSKGGFWLHILAALVLLVGGWLLIGEIPTIVASGDKDLWEGLKVTVFFSLGTVPFQLGIALFLSVLLFQKLRGSNIFRIIYFIPYVTPGIASAAVFQQMFSNRQSAPINMLLKILGLPPQQWLYEPRGVITMIGESLGWAVPDWASGPSLALTVIILHSIWTYVGYDTVIYLAGLGNISTEMNDQAEVDGANQWQVFRYITFPLLSPTTYFLSLIAIIGTFKAFNTIWILRSNLALGTTDTFSVTIFIEFFEKLRYGYASAMSFILFAIILSLSYINNKTQGSRVFYG